MSKTDKTYRVQLGNVRTMESFEAAFNEGFIRQAGGHWNGNWDAFNDYLSWPEEDSFVLVLQGWSTCDALTMRELEVFEDILASNPHVSVMRT